MNSRPRPRSSPPGRTRDSHSSLAVGGEFDLIRGMLDEWKDIASGIGDDAAVLQPPAGEKLLISTDSSVEGFHFGADWPAPEEVGYRAAAAALSDLAAMAATPIGMLVALSLPPARRNDTRAIARGIGDLARRFSCPVIGGNITRATELSITITVLGSAQNPLSRSGALAGDRVYVTGELGGPGAAVASWRSGRTPAPQMRARFASPVPRIKEAKWLAEHGATALIDLSDGLGQDLEQLAAASGRSLRVDAERLPLMTGIEITDALRSGEEYELIATGGPFDTEAFEMETGLPLTEIGVVENTTSRPGVVLILRGREIAVPRGHDHFASE